MYLTLAILGGFVWIYSLLAPRIEKSVLSGPIIFVAFGVLIGPDVLGLISHMEDFELLSVLAELTLAVVLLTDAASADLSVLSRFRTLPIRLLVIGLPLTILLGVIAGVGLFPELPLLEICLLATMLAPTDAALGKAVVSNESVPSSIRQGLNVESGLNDGICVPVLFLFLTLLVGEDTGQTTLMTGLTLFAEAVGIGLLVGVAFSASGVWLMKFTRHKHWASHSWNKVTLLGLAFACFGAAQALGGSGFIASFVAGLLFGQLYKSDKEPLLDAAEGIGDTLSLLTWVLFGAIAVFPAFQSPSISGLIYGLLSLTLLRMAPVFLSLIGLVKNTEAKLFIGWFGPRGLASVVFAVIVFDEGAPHANLLSQVVVYTVLLSIILHGVTANPWASRIGRKLKNDGNAGIA